MAIDLVFAGLMVLCFNGKDTCTFKEGLNTAWSVNAGGEPTICGRKSLERTQLRVSYRIADFETPELKNAGELIECKPDEGGNQICTFEYKSLCTKMTKGTISEIPYEYLLSMRDIDGKFKDWDSVKLGTYSTPIAFPVGEIKYHHLVPPDEDKDHYWFRSSKDSPPIGKYRLADQITSSYSATQVKITDCSEAEESYLLLTQPSTSTAAAEIHFLNYVIDPLQPDTDRKYDDLAYLIWYHRLGIWEEDRCPEYKKEAIFLRCKWKDEKTCAKWDNSQAAGSTMWPPIVK